MTELGSVNPVAGDRNGAIAHDAVEEPGFQVVVVFRSIDVDGADGSEGNFLGSEVGFCLGFAFVTAFRIGGIAFDMGHLVGFEVDSGGANVDEVFDAVFEDFD